MHEEVLLRDLVRKVEEVTRAQEALRASSVRLWVGALSHFSEATLRSRWPEAVRGTPAEGSRLEVEVSGDVNDPRATGLLLVSLDVEGTAAGSRGFSPPPRGAPPRA